MERHRIFSSEKLAVSENLPCCKHCTSLKKYHALQIFLLFAVSLCTYFASVSHQTCSCSANSPGVDELKKDIQKLQLKMFELQERGRETWKPGDLEENRKEGQQNPAPISNLTRVDMLRRFKRTPTVKKHRRSKKHKKSTVVVQLVGRGGLDTALESADERFSGTYHKWRYADWFDKLKHKPFQLNYRTGRLAIKRGGTGLYVLYAQITMLGNVKHGFYVYRNNNVICTCNNAFEVHNNSSHDDAVSCSTFGIFPLEEFDVISIGHTSNVGTKALFDSNSSYFGLYKIASYKNKKRMALV